VPHVEVTEKPYLYFQWGHSNVFGKKAEADAIVAVLKRHEEQYDNWRVVKEEMPWSDELGDCTQITYRVVYDIPDDVSEENRRQHAQLMEGIVAGVYLTLMDIGLQIALK
jgi:hypothetical protein